MVDVGPVPRPHPPKLARKALRADKTPEAYLEAMVRSHATLNEAACAIGISRNTLRAWLRRYGIEVKR